MNLVRPIRIIGIRPRTRRQAFASAGAVLVGLLAAGMGLRGAAAASLPDTVKAVKPSIVAVGTYQETRRPPAKFFGTGFVVGNGNQVMTCAHVVAQNLNKAHGEYLAVFQGTRHVAIRRVVNVHEDPDHDVAILGIDGPPMPALTLGDDSKVEEGQSIAFIGFPIGAILGLYPATNQGIVSALTPIAIPVLNPQALNAEMVNRLREPFPVFQLDATAYPGNSGSPLFDPATGKVLGILNSVYVKETKEKVLQDPSAITYAIPIHYGLKLLEELEAPSGGAHH